LPEYQRRGLAAWMMQAIKDMVNTWPLLRGMLVMTETEHAAELYKRKLGVLDFDKGPSAGLFMYEMPGNGCKALPEGK
jgi:ribosomal protein S18 acetylase RimI-like enzyme